MPHCHVVKNHHKVHVKKYNLHWLLSWLAHQFLCPGGDPMVQGTWNTPRIPSLFHSCGCVVSGLYICWDGESEAIVSWGLWDWWTIQNLQVYTPEQLFSLLFAGKLYMAVHLNLESQCLRIFNFDLDASRQIWLANHWHGKKFNVWMTWKREVMHSLCWAYRWSWSATQESQVSSNFKWYHLTSSPFVCRLRTK